MTMYKLVMIARSSSLDDQWLAKSGIAANLLSTSSCVVVAMFTSDLSSAKVDGARLEENEDCQHTLSLLLAT